MKSLRHIAICLAAVLALAAIIGSMLPQFDYARQDREHISAPPSRQHWMGTDELGRDRLSRLLHGTQVSILLAPAAALLSTLLALAFGAVPGFSGGFSARASKTAIDLFLSIPWLFLLLIVRALMPLNTSPAASVTITFLMLGILGWAAPARILFARAQSMRQSEFIILARSNGISGLRLLARHVAPNLRPVLLAQFLIAVPVFILSEANLSVLGLGVSEPLPSLGSLLRDLESVLSIRADIWRFVPLAVIVVLVSALQMAVSEPEELFQ
jgi:peptide/nickel transport system permease protein